MSEDFFGNGNNNGDNNYPGEGYQEQQNAYNQQNVNDFNQNQYGQNDFNQNQYNQQNYSYNNQQNESAPMAVACMVLGIISVVMSCLCTYAAIPIGIVGLALGSTSNKRNEGKKGFVTAGVVCGICGIVISVVWIIIAFAMVGSGMYNSIFY